MYEALCREIAKDAELLAMGALAPSSQPPPNLLFASVHYLLLGGEEHPLRAWYPALAAGDDPGGLRCPIAVGRFDAILYWIYGPGFKFLRGRKLTGV